LNNQITIFADSIRDPGNLGTIVRCADWFGISQVVCSPDSADIYNPKTVQSTMGSIARVKVYYKDLPALLNDSRDTKVHAAALNGKNVKQMKPLEEGVIVIGNESKGINNAIMQLAHEKITIPGYGKAESLNAAVATGIILSHLIPSRNRS
jgi:RNA methyltransferase, TrmH family